MAHDYVATALSRLPGQFDGSTKLRGFVEAMLDFFPGFQSTIDDLKSGRWIDNAIGAQLDGAGYIVGEDRKGREDEAYREAIKFRAFLNVSQGTPNDLIYGLRYLTQPSDIQYIESYPATALLFSNGFFIDRSIQPAMQALAPAGISVVPVAVSFMDAPFRFSKEPPPGELFVNNGDDYLIANGSDIQVSTGAAAFRGSSFGGVVPSELDVTLGYLDVGGPTLAVYNPNTTTTLGHDNLTGVFQ